MALEGQPVSGIQETDLIALRDDAVAEGKRLDYKLKIGMTRDQKKEFLKDVSSFANSGGGHLLVGVREDPPGQAADFPGIALDEIDAEKARLENLLRDCVSPRLRGVEMHSVPVGDGSQAVLVIRIPRSLSQPHVVTFEGHWRFYARNSAGAFQVDVEQLRAAFLASDTEAQLTRGFRTSRLASLLAGELPVQPSSADALVVHLVPASAWDPGKRVDAVRLRGALDRRLQPIGRMNATHRHNLDGLLIYASKNGSVSGYLQLFTSGIIESVLFDPLDSRNGELLVPTGWIEDQLWRSVPLYLSFLSADVEADFPVFLMVSLLGVKGGILATRDEFFRDRGRPIDRPDLILPEVPIEDPSTPRGEYLAPVFDALWNAGGYERCEHLEGGELLVT